MIYETEFAKRPLKIETNSLASQSSGSVLVTFGKTVVLGTATMGKADIEVDFLPLTVDYEERFYAAGKISGSRYVRREGKPSEEAVLVSRMIDRTIRPYFSDDLRREIQVVLTVFAFDEENDPDFPSLLAASLALSISDIPWDGPVAGVRIGISNDSESSKADFILNPTYENREEAKLDLFISGIADKENNLLFNMLDGGAEEILEEEVISAIDFSKKEISSLIDFQKDIQKKEGKKKIVLEKEKEDLNALYKKHYSKIKENLLLEREKDGKSKTALSQEKLKEELELNSVVFKALTEKTLHQLILEDNLRSDGRRIDEIRNISCKAGILPQTHGSGLFFRGLTHVLSTLTLGAPGDHLLLEGMEITGKKRFLHHYNFPSYSVGEVRRAGPPGRREIGHGALSEKALRPVIPEIQEFPYTIRIVSEILSSNGSTSQASVCASSLALFDAGVPVKKSVAGISCGLIMEDDSSKPISQRKYKILTDIQGPEDNLGDMDFKVAGTKNGITAIQLDVKVRGLTLQILKDGFLQAKKAREEILEKMDKVISKPRPQLSLLAPRILNIKINPEKIREVIGPGGKMINEIIEETDSSIDVEDNGSIFVTAKNKDNAEKAIEWIKNITREVKEGEVFQGKIKTIVNFGVFVELLPKQEGLLHISEIFPDRRSEQDLNKKFKVGQIIPVKVRNIDYSGKIKLSLFKHDFHQEPKV